MNNVKKATLRRYVHVKRISGERTPDAKCREEVRHYKINQILECSHVKSQNNGRVCMKHMNVNEAKSMFQHRVVWLSILPAYPCEEMT